MASIDHNLPCLNTTPSYDYVFPNLIIKNITALTRTAYRYWVAFRVRYITGELIDSLASININLMRHPTQTLFTALVVNTPRIAIPYSDFHDPAGFHSIGFNNYDTQVITATDNML